MSSITNNVVNTVTLTDEKSFSAEFIFSNKETALHGVHTALLTILAGAAVEQEFNRSNIFSCKYNDVFTGNASLFLMGIASLISAATKLRRTSWNHSGCSCQTSFR